MWLIFALMFACSLEKEEPKAFDPSLEIWQPTNGALHILDFPLTGEPIQSILSYQKAGSIHTLELNNTSLTPADIIFLSKAQSTKNIQYLSLQGNSVQNLGLQYLATSPLIKHLKELDLSDTGVSSKGLEHLLKNPEFKPKKLVLSNNSFHSSILNALAENPHIEVIDLSNCKLTDGAVALFLSRTKARVIKLNNNLIGIPNVLSPQIEELYLYQTRLDDQQLQAFARIEAKGLKKLFLGRIFVSYDTLISLSHASWYPKLDVLSLNPRKQTEEEKQQLLQSFGDHRWIQLNDPPITDEEEIAEAKER